MGRIEKILVGVDLHHGDRIASPDLCEESKAAVTEALQLAQAWGATVTFCSVLELSAQSQSLIEHDLANVFETVEDFAAEILKQEVEKAKEAGVEANSLVAFGKAWEVLTTQSLQGHYDLVILGARSKSRASRVLFGSTAQKVMRFAKCPVWVVKPTPAHEVRNVAVAVDLSPSSLATLQAGVTAARAIGARFHLLHVLELSDFRYLTLAGMADEALQRIEKTLRAAATESLQTLMQQADFRTLPQGAKLELLSGSPDAAILKYVDSEQIDLLVIGSHGHSGVTGLVLGNTAERMLPVVHASLMVVKPADFVSPYDHSPS